LITYLKKYLAQEKLSGLLGILMLASWLSAVVYYTLPRWLHTDSAYTLFRLLNKEALVYDRFTNYLQLAPAVLAVKMALPANVVMHLVNITLPLFFVAAWFFTQRISTHKALVFPLMLWLSGPEMLFIGYSEIHMAVLCCSLFWFLSTQANPPKWALFVTSLGAFMAHPAALMLMGGSLLAVWISSNESKKWRDLILINISAAFLQYLISPATNNYDSGLLEKIKTPSGWLHITSHYSWDYLCANLSGWMWPLIAMFVTLAVIGFKQVKPLKTILGLAYIVICCLMLVVVYQSGDATVMMQKFFYPVLVVAALLFFSHNSYAKLVHTYTAVFWLSGIVFFLLHGNGYFYRQRAKEVAFQSKQYTKDGYQKVIVNHYNEAIGTPWALPYESMCIAAIEKQPTVSIRYSENGRLKPDSMAVGDTLYLGATFMPPFHVKTLNPVYFKLDEKPYFIDSLKM
jgi:hypothetical protein